MILPWASADGIPRMGLLALLAASGGDSIDAWAPLWIPRTVQSQWRFCGLQICFCAGTATQGHKRSHLHTAPLCLRHPNAPGDHGIEVTSAEASSTAAISVPLGRGFLHIPIGKMREPANRKTQRMAAVSEALFKSVQERNAGLAQSQGWRKGEVRGHGRMVRRDHFL